MVDTPTTDAPGSDADGSNDAANEQLHLRPVKFSVNKGLLAPQLSDDLSDDEKFSADSVDWTQSQIVCKSLADLADAIDKHPECQVFTLAEYVLSEEIDTADLKTIKDKIESRKTATYINFLRSDPYHALGSNQDVVVDLLGVMAHPLKDEGPWQRLSSLNLRFAPSDYFDGVSDISVLLQQHFPSLIGLLPPLRNFTYTPEVTSYLSDNLDKLDCFHALRSDVPKILTLLDSKEDVNEDVEALAPMMDGCRENPATAARLQKSLYILHHSWKADELILARHNLLVTYFSVAMFATHEQYESFIAQLDQRASYLGAEFVGKQYVAQETLNYVRDHRHHSLSNILLQPAFDALDPAVQLAIIESMGGSLPVSAKIGALYKGYGQADSLGVEDALNQMLYFNGVVERQQLVASNAKAENLIEPLQMTRPAAASALLQVYVSHSSLLAEVEAANTESIAQVAASLPPRNGGQQISQGSAEDEKPADVVAEVSLLQHEIQNNVLSTEAALAALFSAQDKLFRAIQRATSGSLNEKFLAIQLVEVNRALLVKIDAQIIEVLREEPQPNDPERQKSVVRNISDVLAQVNSTTRQKLVGQVGFAMMLALGASLNEATRDAVNNLLSPSIAHSFGVANGRRQTQHPKRYVAKYCISVIALVILTGIIPGLIALYVKSQGKAAKKATCHNAGLTVVGEGSSQSNMVAAMVKCGVFNSGGNQRVHGVSMQAVAPPLSPSAHKKVI